jgi:hypothetical protein
MTVNAPASRAPWVEYNLRGATLGALEARDTQPAKNFPIYKHHFVHHASSTTTAMEAEDMPNDTTDGKAASSVAPGVIATVGTMVSDTL